MPLHNIVLHQVIKEINGDPELNLSEQLLPINDITLEFVDKIISSYSSKNPTYGVFEENSVVYPFQTLAQNYLEGGGFLEFTEQAMEILEDRINKPSTTGGYVIFVHYEHNTVDFIFTVMLDQSVQFTVADVDMTIRKLQTLDIERMARANRINVNKWQGGDEQYLSFIKGTRNVSEYFRLFVGSTDLTSSKENIDNLRTAMETFMIERNYTENQKMQTYSRVSHYANARYRNDEDLTLESISSLMNNEEPLAFTEFITANENLEVSGVFRVAQKAHLTFMERIIVKEQGYSLDFDRGLKGTKIFREGNNLVIRDVSDDILNKL